jgi:hypothetical protein
MLRVFLTIVLPLVLPSAIYFTWIWIANMVSDRKPRSWAATPWVWLAGAGVVLLAGVLFVVNVHFGTSSSGTYVPPRWENGRVVPGHFVPAQER